MSEGQGEVQFNHSVAQRHVLLRQVPRVPSRPCQHTVAFKSECDFTLCRCVCCVSFALHIISFATSPTRSACSFRLCLCGWNIALSTACMEARLSV